MTRCLSNPSAEGAKQPSPARKRWVKVEENGPRKGRHKEYGELRE